MEYEMLLFLQSAGIGAVLCLCYEFLAALRNVIPHSRTAVSVEDMIYWTAAGIFIFIVIYRTNQGILRSFLFLGNILGAWICSLTAGPLFRRGIQFICGMPVNFVKSSIKRLLFLIRRCNILLHKHKNVQKKCFLKKKRIRQLEKIKKKKKQKKNSK